MVFKSVFAEAIATKTQVPALKESALQLNSVDVQPIDATLADEVHRAIPMASEQDFEHLHNRTPRAMGPAMPNDTERVYFSDLLAIPAGDDVCPCCGKAQWWDNAGRRTCGVCHPNPRRVREALKTEPTTKEAVPRVT